MKDYRWKYFEMIRISSLKFRESLRDHVRVRKNERRFVKVFERVSRVTDWSVDERKEGSLESERVKETIHIMRRTTVSFEL